MKEYHKIQTVFKRDASTKENRIIIGDYSVPEFAYLANNTWAFTEKVDGTNIRVMWDGVTIRFGGKTDNASIPVRLYDALTAQFSDPSLFVSKFGDTPVCLYGEGYGAKIQKGGGNYRSDNGFVLFDVRVGEWWLQREDVEDIASHFVLGVVPIIGYGTLDDMISMARAGIPSTWGDFQAEGIVARPAVELRTRSGQRLITKIKCRDFESL
jgi:RNA ligase